MQEKLEPYKGKFICLWVNGEKRIGNSSEKGCDCKNEKECEYKQGF